MTFWAQVLLSAGVALTASVVALVLVFFGMAFINQYFPSEKEIIRRKAADLLQARPDLKEDEREFLKTLRWKSPATRYFLAMPKIFGMVFVLVFAAFFYFR
jgi:hypothetical protein